MDILLSLEAETKMPASIKFLSKFSALVCNTVVFLSRFSGFLKRYALSLTPLERDKQVGGGGR